MFDEFDIVECEDLLRKEKPDLMGYHGKLKEMADSAEFSEGKRKAYLALAEACGLYLYPSNVDNPLQPMYRLADGRTSFSIDRFSEEEVEFFEAIVLSLHIATLRARVADILWLLRRKNAYQFASVAIQAYLEVPLSSHNWLNEGNGEFWERGTILALKLGKEDEPFHGKCIKDHLCSFFSVASVQDASYLLFLESLFMHLEGKTNLLDSEKQSVAEKLNEAVACLEEAEQYRKARDVLEAEKHWASDTIAIQSRIAQTLENEIHSLMPSLAGQHISVQLLCNQLIDELRRIPEKRRDEFDVQKRLTNARAILIRCREHTTEDLHLGETGPIDISALVERTREKFYGLELTEALRRFASLPTQDKNALRTEVEQLIQNHPLLYFFDRYTLSEDGRIITSTSGLITSPKDEKEVQENEKLIAQSMVEAFERHVQLAVQGVILPAYYTIVREHYIPFSTVVEIVRQSPIVPPGRHYAFARMLDFGFHGEFSMAMYVLAPELENLIRFHLKGFGATTTTIDGLGVEQELGMSALMAKPEASECFGENFAWELKALFCDPGGANLRNNYAHGLSTNQLGQSVDAVYAWWLVFRMIMFLRPVEDVSQAAKMSS